ncbi:hypothetical protein QE152_g32381 [Popillia japonica]|uniref:Uncharacterized protein n=1 Tax=Popillia japonica TaxID=7064 RepID=A0AAW1IZ58_POPJA
MDKLQKPTDMAMVLKDFQNYKRIQDRLNDDRKKQQRDINILLIEKHSLTDELAAIMEKSKQIQIRYKELNRNCLNWTNNYPCLSSKRRLYSRRL